MSYVWWGFEAHFGDVRTNFIFNYGPERIQGIEWTCCGRKAGIYRASSGRFSYNYLSFQLFRKHAFIAPKNARLRLGLGGFMPPNGAFIYSYGFC